MSLNTMLAACCAVVVAAVAVPKFVINSTLFIPSKCFAKNWRGPMDMFAAMGQCKRIVDGKGNIRDLNAEMTAAAPAVAESTQKFMEALTRFGVQQRAQ